MKTFKTIFIAAVLAVLLAPLCAQTAEKKPTVVIVPFEAKSKGIEQDDCDIVTESFESEYARTGSALVVNRSTLKKIQTEQAFQNSDWSNNDKTAKLGEALNAQQLVFGTLRFYNDILFVTVQVQNIETLAVLASVNVRVKDTMELLETIPDICKNIAAQMQGESAPTVVSKNTSSTKPVQTTKSGVGKTYQIGDIGPGGGYIFYTSVSGFPVYSGDKMTICYYLECSPDAIGDRATWCPCTSSWCNVKTNNAIGAGKKNTENILSANHSSKALYAFNCAAKACAEYSTKTTKQGEWYLPSRMELEFMYIILHRLGKITQNNRWNWSSCQMDKKYAYGQKFIDGGQKWYNDKDYFGCVWAVRAF
ncbi:MAG: hypothetical protein K2F89_00915 [Treponemataceae bacterium]|nr:hypothetical protein [Treponemataceae bacterium]